MPTVALQLSPFPSPCSELTALTAQELTQGLLPPVTSKSSEEGCIIMCIPPHTIYQAFTLTTRYTAKVFTWALGDWP